MTIKHISFDVWNTLITANKRYALERTEAISYFAGIPPKGADIMYCKIKEYLDQRAEKGICGTSTTAWHILGKNLNMELKAIAEMRHTCEQAFIANPPHLNEALVDQLINLDNHYELSIKSNTNFISGKVLSEAVGFDKMPWFSFIHFSDDFMMCKPDVLFFAQTIINTKLNDINAEEILHVGDSEIFDGKCVDIGFNFCKIDNPEHLLNKLKNGELFNA